jgi:hypothetical protein
MATHVVVAAAVVLRSKAGGSQYIYKGAPVDAEAFTEASVAHALTVGLIAEVEESVRDAEVVEVEAPDKSWTLEQIDEFAAKWEIGIPADAKKDDKIAAIAAEIEKRTAGLEAQQSA